MAYVSLNFTLKDVGIKAVDIASFMKETINNPNSIGFSKWLLKVLQNVISQPLTQDILVDKIILLIIGVLRHKLMLPVLYIRKDYNNTK